MSVGLDNALAGFADKINRSNLETARIKVTTPADALSGALLVLSLVTADQALAAAQGVDCRFEVKEHVPMHEREKGLVKV